MGAIAAAGGSGLDFHPDESQTNPVSGFTASQWEK